ncbi:unnamed protein product, partial [Effrenium voratum]
QGAKPLSEFESVAATMPWAAVCADCVAHVKRRPNRGRAGWCTCRACDLFFPGAGAAEHDGQEHVPQMRRRVARAGRARRRQAPKALPEVQAGGKRRKARVTRGWSRRGKNWLEVGGEGRAGSRKSATGE